MLPVDGAAIFIRLPLTYRFPGGVLQAPNVASTDAAVVRGPQLRLSSATQAAIQFADDSSMAVGRLLSRYIQALAAGEDPADTLQ